MAARRPPLSVATRAFLALTAILCLFPLAPWPRLQLALHAAIVVSFCVDPRQYLVTALLAAGSGWTVEGSLKLLPRLGGTPWAAMTAALLAAFLAKHWPPETRAVWMLRCLGLTVALLSLTHLMVRIAAGPHAFGQGWSAAFLTLPLWSWWTWRLQAQRG